MITNIKEVKKLTSVNTLFEMERDGTLYYQIIHTPFNAGKGVIHDKQPVGSEFDHDERLVAAIENYIEEHGVLLVPRSDTGTLRFTQSKKTGAPALALAVLLDATKREISIAEARKFRVQHIGGAFIEPGIENCHGDNLASTGTPILKNTSREFTVVAIGEKQYIFLHLFTYGKSAQFDYSPELLDFLAKPSNFTFIVNGAGRIQARIPGKTTYKPYVSLIAKAFYEGLLNQENFENIETILNDMTQKERYHVDHLNDDKDNNCSCNLSLMTSETNIAKHHLANNFSPPYYPYYAYDTQSQKYLIELSVDLTPGEEPNRLFYWCADERALLHWLETKLNRTYMTQCPGSFFIPINGEISWLMPPIIPADENPKRDAAADLARAQEMLKLYRLNPWLFREWKVTKEQPNILDIGQMFCDALHTDAKVVITPMTPEESAEYKAKRKRPKIKRRIKWT